MNEYNFQKIESKWQNHWSENNSIKCDINAKEKNFYNLFHDKWVRRRLI